MKTKIIMDNGKAYEVDFDAKTLIKDHLTDENGMLLNEFVHFEDFTLNPVHIASLEENDDNNQKSIGF